jgi:hypothetical protein
MTELSNDDEILKDDALHPIPAVHSYDTVLTFDGGGAYLGIVIATPIDASERSLHRLKEKQRFYLESFYSDYGHEMWNTPKEGKMRIYFKIHPDSSEVVFKLVEGFSEVARSRGVQVVVSETF